MCKSLSRERKQRSLREKYKRIIGMGLTAILLVAVVTTVVIEVTFPMNWYTQTGGSAFVLRAVGTHSIVAIELDTIRQPINFIELVRMH